jgi:hypothetical protein
MSLKPALLSILLATAATPTLADIGGYFNYLSGEPRNNEMLQKIDKHYTTLLTDLFDAEIRHDPENYMDSDLLIRFYSRYADDMEDRLDAPTQNDPLEICESIALHQYYKDTHSLFAGFAVKNYDLSEEFMLSTTDLTNAITQLGRINDATLKKLAQQNEKINCDQPHLS